ncbi:MAG TPA: hypothetical protein EYG54_04225 [Myxococcales bacterium]|nr:hypothetical protein [Myxococcales bacterium]
MPAPAINRPGRLTRFLDRGPGGFFVVYAVVASFGAYFCMYAFRKPFAAARFADEPFALDSLELKSALVISQVVGYALSKYVGIRVCSELHPRYHPLALVGLIAWAEMSLLLFAELPGSWKTLAIFLNGLSLGMVWGLVVRFLEGRVTSELLLAGLSCSFIVSSGIVKDVGRAMMSGAAAEWWNGVPLVGSALAGWLGKVSESWMPAITGLHFLPFFILFVWMLAQLPRRTDTDVEQRQSRDSMDGVQRVAFLREYLPGLVMLVGAYFLLTAYRDFRDNFSVEIFEGLGYPYAGNETIITQAEILVAVGVILILALLNTVRQSRRGLLATFAVMAGGTGLLAASSLLLQAELISGFWWMTLIGLGSYLAYVPYGSLLFERLMANTAIVGTAVFAIYLADAVGYTGSVAMLLYKDLAASEMSRLAFFQMATWAMAGVGTVLLLSSCAYFLRNPETTRSSARGELS